MSVRLPSASTRAQFIDEWNSELTDVVEGVMTAVREGELGAETVRLRLAGVPPTRQHHDSASDACDDRFHARPPFLMLRPFRARRHAK